MIIIYAMHIIDVNFVFLLFQQNMDYNKSKLYYNVMCDDPIIVHDY